MSDPSYFIDGGTVTARALEVPDASFANGMNLGGSNAPGIGINEGVANLVGTPEQFTLLDQAGAARTPQDSQHLGGDGLTEAADWPTSGGVAGAGTDPIAFGTVNTNGDGGVSASASATLTALATGWTGV